VLPFSPRLRIALATAEEIAKREQRREVTCLDILRGISSLTGGVADGLLKARGFCFNVAAVPWYSVNHEPRAYAEDSLRALSAAIQDAAGGSRQLIGIEDLLLGILSSPCPEIARLFGEKNVNVEELISEVRKQM
jgi:ATP-dependent Clp protease ATP-binding subunit ClpA